MEEYKKLSAEEWASTVRQTDNVELERLPKGFSISGEVEEMSNVGRCAYIMQDENGDMRTFGLEYKNSDAIALIDKKWGDTKFQKAQNHSQGTVWTNRS